MATRGFWTCRVKSCKAVNANRLRKCAVCGKAKPPKKRPAHMAALDIPYETYIEINGGEHCGICGRERDPDGRRLQRDHDHRGEGMARGLLCFACNRWLRGFMTVEWLRAAIKYLERAEARSVSGRGHDA